MRGQVTCVPLHCTSFATSKLLNDRINGLQIPQQLMPSRLGSAASQERYVYGSERRPPGTGSKRTYRDMNPVSAPHLRVHALLVMWACAMHFTGGCYAC